MTRRKTLNTMKQKDIKTIDLQAKEWFDKVNGNSYFSARATLNFGMPDEKTVFIPFQYGYGEHYHSIAAHQQASKGQEHNALFVNKEGGIIRGHIATALNIEVVKLIDFLNEDNFPLYPAGCNDTHVETAVKAALKTINLA